MEETETSRADAALAAGLPPELLEHLNASYDAPAVDDVLAGYAAPRATTLRANTLKTTPDAVAAALDAAGIAWRAPAFCRDAFVVAPRSEDALRALPLYERGEIYLQSLSAMLPALALDPQSGENILDMAAAPGGKTCHLAALSGDAACLTACEKNPVRAQKLRHNLEKQGVTRCNVMECDARRLDEFFTFDKVLLDAPCSGSGTVSLAGGSYCGGFSAELLTRSVATQRALLNRALAAVRPGGIVVYATCSVLPEENERLVESVLSGAGRAKSQQAPKGKHGKRGRGKGAARSANDVAPFQGEAEIVPLPQTLLRDVPLLPCSLEGAACVKPTNEFEGFFVCAVKRTR
ncbi:MAG: RsmB/NOP family class I SAM-dependent RNA methyltransferase [Eggerthellaceae bacterium]|nr:RsmB/NOP family class I SAM-dependent RNA methyltransferase [Eggerthellaceae bacterium]